MSIWRAAGQICENPSTALPRWCCQSFSLTRTSQPCSFSVAAVKTVSRDCYGMRQDSSCSTNAWRMVSINGRIRRKTCWKYPSSSFAGLPKACPSRSPRPYKRLPLHTVFNFKLCTTPANLWIAQPASILNSRAFCGIMGREI